MGRQLGTYIDSERTWAKGGPTTTWVLSRATAATDKSGTHSQMTSQQSTKPQSQITTPKRASKMASGQSLNHLLNFTLPPRQPQPPQSLPRRRRKHGTHQGVWNKERFVNAQYRFMMNPTGDYTVHFADPDIFFQWPDILQVIVPRSSALATAAASGERFAQDEGHMMCPICLAPPTAPRMTKCGHVFCFPCILHYLNTSDNIKWVRCPICFDSVNEKQLKCVKWYDESADKGEGAGTSQAEASSHVSDLDSALVGVPREGSTMRMRLMQRPQITTLALPRSHTWPSDLIPPHQAPFHFLPDVYNYAKFMLATPAYIISCLARDLDELATERRTLASMNDKLGISFVDAAEAKLRHQIAEAAALGSAHLKDAIDKAGRDQSEIDERIARLEQRRQAEAKGNNQPSDLPEAFLVLQSGAFNALPTTIPPTTHPSHTPTPNRNPRQRRNLNPPPPSTQTYYYYQAASGLPIFLHPLDIKILFSHFNSYSSFPDTITVHMESFAEGTVNDDLRKRCKYLAHMPEGADVVFIEADLEGVVGEDGLKNFEVALKTRRARRKEKGRKDDRAKARAEEKDREREKTTTTSATIERSQVVPLDRVASPVEVEEICVPESSPQPQVAGAWGARSFATAAHAVPMQVQSRAVSGQRPVVDLDDEYDMDAAWHELEQRSSGGRRKRSNKLVVLGGGGGRRR